MKKPLILHIMDIEKFTQSFINFVESNHQNQAHLFIIRGKSDLFKIKSKKNIIQPSGALETLIFSVLLLWYGQSSKKIILHSLINRKTVRLLWAMQWLLKKSHWIIWGADLYSFNSKNKNLAWYLDNYFRQNVIKNTRGLVTYIRGDIELARRYYSATGIYHECLVYPSNTFKVHSLSSKQNDCINILAGNSSDSSNNHLQIFEKILPHKNKNILIYCPLSYGDKKNQEFIHREGMRLFGEKFIPLLEFMPFDSYMSLLGNIDIAIFAHTRQQAMGNTITLLGLGKKIYLQKETTQWELFQSLGAEVFDFKEFEPTPITNQLSRKNKEIISTYFSNDTLKKQLTQLFQE